VVYRLWSYIQRRLGGWLAAYEGRGTPAPLHRPFQEEQARVRERALAAITEKQESEKLLEGTQARIRFLEEREQAALAAGDAEEAERRREELNLRRAELPALTRRHDEALAQIEEIKAEVKRLEERVRAYIEREQRGMRLYSWGGGWTGRRRSPLRRWYLLLLLRLGRLWRRRWHEGD